MAACAGDGHGANGLPGHQSGGGKRGVIQCQRVTVGLVLVRRGNGQGGLVDGYGAIDVLDDITLLTFLGRCCEVQSADTDGIATGIRGGGTRPGKDQGTGNHAGAWILRFGGSEVGKGITVVDFVLTVDRHVVRCQHSAQ